MPWNKKCEENLDIKAAKEKLDEEHYGLEKVKDRILEFLAVRILTSKGQTPILCLAGPPGTGKTSIARSLAEALGRPYVRISLGGVRDEAEIPGTSQDLRRRNAWKNCDSTSKCKSKESTDAFRRN